MEELNIECIDYVLSGLPFTSLPEEVSKRILNNAMEAIHENGEFITFQYSLVKKGFIQHFFPEITLEKYGSISRQPTSLVAKELRRAYA